MPLVDMTVVNKTKKMETYFRQVSDIFQKLYQNVQASQCKLFQQLRKTEIKSKQNILCSTYYWESSLFGDDEEGIAEVYRPCLR